MLRHSLLNDMTELVDAKMILESQMSFEYIETMIVNLVWRNPQKLFPIVYPWVRVLIDFYNIETVTTREIMEIFVRFECPMEKELIKTRFLPQITTMKNERLSMRWWTVMYC